MKWGMTYEKDVLIIEEMIKLLHPLYERTQLEKIRKDLSNNNTISGIYDNQIKMIKEKLKL